MAQQIAFNGIGERRGFSRLKLAGLPLLASPVDRINTVEQQPASLTGTFARIGQPYQLSGAKPHRAGPSAVHVAQ